MVIKPWTTVKSSVLIENSFLKIDRELVRLPNGEQIDYFINDRADVGMVFAVTKTHKVVLVRQYKHGAQGLTLELPGGALEPGESPVDGALRELEEETGLVPIQPPRLIASFYDDATRQRNMIHILFCSEAELTGKQHLDANEGASGIEVELVDLDDLPSLIRSGAIKAESSVAGIYRALDDLKNN